jgi:hypothetical protein
MTQTELEYAQKAMQQQWYDLVMAEQQGSSLNVLEHMYDTYILLAEEYNRCYEHFTSLTHNFSQGVKDAECRKQEAA